MVDECPHDWGYFDYAKPNIPFVRDEQNGARCQNCLAVRDLSAAPVQSLGHLTLTMVLQAESGKYAQAAITMRDMGKLADAASIQIEKMIRALVGTTVVGTTEGHALSSGVAYCVKCRAKVEIANAKEVMFKNGKPAIRGDCALCGTSVFRIGAQLTTG